MARYSVPAWLTFIFVLPGCLPITETSIIPTTPFGSPAPSTAHSFPDAPPATTEAAINVARTGLKIVTANPAIGFQPRFCTIGGEAAPLEIFHNGETDVIITETLARRCKSEGELAAVLSTELARIVNERSPVRLDALDDRGPPPAVNVGNDYGGNFGPADGVRMMEVAKYERNRKLFRDRASAATPDTLARVYLQQAGFNPADLDAVAPLLRSAEGNNKLEKLMVAPPAK
jgi:hypothetical protein